MLKFDLSQRNLSRGVHNVRIGPLVARWAPDTRRPNLRAAARIYFKSRGANSERSMRA